MVSLDDAVVARLNRYGTHFEILVDPEAVDALPKDATDQQLLDTMAVDDVFIDWSEGDRAPDEQLAKAFETTDVATIARRILAEGEVQLTQEQRKHMLEQKQKRILTTLARETWNPQTRTPHPTERIERALAEAKFKVDPLRRVEEQMQAAFKLLQPLLPIAFEQVQVAIKIPAEHAGSAHGHVRNLGDLQNEEWQNNGDWVGIIRIPAGAQGEVYERLNGLTHGSVETRLLE